MTRTCIRVFALCLTISAATAWSQSSPSKPIRLIVAFAPGGGGDINARLYAPELTRLLGQPVIVENRPGAGTNLATEYVARAAPDGHTLLVNSAAVVINMSLYKKVNYDTFRDLAAVSIFSESPNILAVHPSLPAKTVSELVALARAKPNAMNYSSGGSGTTQHLTGELFKLKTNTRIVHIPFKGSAPSLTALLGGEVEMTFANLTAVSVYLKSGRLRALATTGANRSARVPAVPTMKESGMPGIEVSVWFGALAPAATPPDVVSAIAAAIGRAARTPEIRQRLSEHGAEPGGNTPDEFARILKREYANWAQVIRASGATAE